MALNSKPPGNRLAAGARADLARLRRLYVALVAVPVIDVLALLPGVPDTVRVAAFVPVVVGSNRTVTEQVAPAASVMPVHPSRMMRYCDESVPLSAASSRPERTPARLHV